MQFIKTPIQDLYQIQPKIWTDNRGYFYESYNQKIFEDQGISTIFNQDNQSYSQKGTLRGLHFQNPPFEQDKLVRVIKGAVIDVAVDIRKHSPTFGQHFAIELNETNQTMFLVPAGFAHGFYTLTDNTIFAYKCSNFYDKKSEGGIIWNDKTLNINWGEGEKIISEKDQILPSFKDFISQF